MKTLKFHNPVSKQEEREIYFNIQIRIKTKKLLRGWILCFQMSFQIFGK